MRGIHKINKTGKPARLVGVLFLFSNTTFILGAIVFIEPILSDPGYLNLVVTHRNQVVFGVLLELLNGVAYIGIAVLMYPILKQRFESLALGYVGFRLVEFVTQILASLCPLALVTLGKEFVEADVPASTSIHIMGATLLAGRFWAFQMLSILFGLGALIFYFMLHQSRLIPRFISIWGLIGATVVLVNALFEISGLDIPNLGVLMLLNELFLGVWLIMKGFNPSAIAPKPLMQRIVQ